MRELSSTQKLIVIVLAVILVIGGIFAYRAFVPLSVLSISSISIAPPGAPPGTQVGNSITGTYWSVTCTADNIGGINFIKFNNATLAATGQTYTWQGKKVTVANDISLELIAAAPYIERPMQLQSVQVTPIAYQNYATAFTIGRDINVADGSTSQNASALYTGSWVTTTSDWVLHTPMEIIVAVNGQRVGAQYIDDVGTVSSTNVYAGKDTTVGNATDYITATKMGALTNGYLPPIWPSVIWWNNQYFFYNDANLQQAIDMPYQYNGNGQSPGTRRELTGNYQNSYAWYWYGASVHSSDGTFPDGYWSDDGAPFPANPNVNIVPGSGISTVNFATSPGWSDGGGGLGILWRAKPSLLNVPLFPTDPKPTGKNIQVLSLMEFLQQVTKAQKPAMPSWDQNYADLQFITDPSAANKGFLRIEMPTLSYVNVVNLLISSDLADTITESVQIANLKMTNHPSDLGQIGDTATFSIDVQQTAATDTVGSAGYIKVVPKSSDWVSITPPTVDTGNMVYGQTKTFSFTVTDLGEPQTTSTSFDVQVFNHNPVQGDQMTDSANIKMTLLARNTQTTTLVINIQDGTSHNPLSGIHVIVNYGTTSVAGDTSGGSVSFNFGSVTPSVTVSAIDLTGAYTTVTETKQLSLGPNIMDLQMYQGAPPPTPIPWFMVGLIAAVVAIVAAIVVYEYRRKKHSK